MHDPLGVETIDAVEQLPHDALDRVLAQGGLASLVIAQDVLCPSAQAR